MGIQKAVVAFVVSALGLANVLFGVDLSVTEGQIAAVIGVVVTLGTTFGVWKVSNTPAA